MDQKCIFGNKIMPFSESTIARIQDFLRKSTIGQNLAELEIEAKFGHFLDKSTGQRIQLYSEESVVFIDGILSNKAVRFQSDISQAIHQKMNKIFNESVFQSQVNKCNILIRFVEVFPKY